MIMQLWRVLLCLCVVVFFDNAHAQTASSGLTPCQQRRAKALIQCRNGQLLGCNIPTCDSDGSFPSTQCVGYTGYCHCEDEEGNEINGTSHKPWQSYLDCKDVREKLKKRKATDWVLPTMHGYCSLQPGCALFHNSSSNQCCPRCRSYISACGPSQNCPPVAGCVRYAENPRPGKCCRHCVELNPYFRPECSDIVCPRGQICVKHYTTGKAYCRCKRCSSWISFQGIRGSDGRLYRSLCHMEQTACLTCKDIRPVWRFRLLNMHPTPTVVPAVSHKRRSPGYWHIRRQYMNKTIPNHFG